jgi:4-amino-4-deoxy-L-arabinose transferase-like glycosyltransferase
VCTVAGDLVPDGRAPPRKHEAALPHNVSCPTVVTILTPEGDEIATDRLEPSGAPGPLNRGPSRRVLLFGLGFLMLLTFVRGLFWVVSMPVWYGDEGAQYAYEQSVATGHGIPVAGRTLIPADVLRLVKDSPVAVERTLPLPPTPSTRWGLVGEQYEGLQSPLYYLLLVPAYWTGRALDGLVGSFYAMRIGSLCMAVATIPLVALLARALLPQRRAVWLLAPALIAVLQIVNMQNSNVDNDGLTMLAGAGCLLALLASRGDLRARRGLLFGAALAAAFLVKACLAALFPALLIAMAAYAIRRRPRLRTMVAWMAAAGGTAVVMVLPYLVFNLMEYHALSGARVSADLVKDINPYRPINLAGAWGLTQVTLRELFLGETTAGMPFSVHYQRLFEWTALATAAMAIGGAAALRRRDELAVMIWIAVSIPLGWITLIVLTFNQMGHQAAVEARYLDCLLPLFAILVGYGAVAVLGSRVGSLALLSVFVAGSFLEVAGDRALILATYTADTIGRSVPVVEQSYADGAALLTSVRASASCPVDAVAITVFGPAPSAVAVNGRQSLPRATDGQWSEYRLAHSVRGNLVVTFSRPEIIATARHLGSVTGPIGNVAITPGGFPAVRLYCLVSDPTTARFGQLYPTNHPHLSLGTLLAWPEVEAWAEAALVALLALLMASGVAARRSGLHRKPSRWSWD